MLDKIGVRFPSEWEGLNKPFQLISAGLAKAQALAVQVHKSAREAFEMIKETVESTQLKPLLANINSMATDIEKLFNIVNSTAIVCIFGSYVRYYAGVAQLIAGLIFAGIGELGILINSEKNSPNKKWTILSKFGLEHVIHGCLNIIRSLGEAFIADFTFSLGNLLLYIPNIKKDFGPYAFHYGILTDQVNVDQKEQDNLVRKEDHSIDKADEEKMAADLIGDNMIDLSDNQVDDQSGDGIEDMNQLETSNSSNEEALQVIYAGSQEATPTENEPENEGRF